MSSWSVKLFPTIHRSQQRNKCFVSLRIKATELIIEIPNLMDLINVGKKQNCDFWRVIKSYNEHFFVLNMYKTSFHNMEDLLDFILFLLLSPKVS